MQLGFYDSIDRLFGSIVVEIALDEDDGGALVARAGGQVAQRADQIGQAAGSGTLGHHLANQIAVHKSFRI